MHPTPDEPSCPQSIPPERPVQQVSPEPPATRRGFAVLTSERRREIASMGGRTAHTSGVAHKFTEQEARIAGHRGGVAVSQDREHMARIGRLGGFKRHRRQLPDVQESP